ncbi:MAG TPA: universal stress protein [Pirellulales bacterium]|jgi:nucleotide-binding universal stress UspA family protein|nr:universal stress protein [Pirellulales bacterium]
MFAPRRILHPTDFSECSALAFAVAIDLAKQNSATLIVLHAVETLGPENVSFGEVRTELEPDSYRQRLMDELKQVVPPEDSKIMTEHILVEGDTAEQIDRYASENKIDLIVMGTHGRTGLARLLTGSVTEEALRRSPCPMLIVRLPHAGAR